MKKLIHLLIISLFFLSMLQSVSADDKLKPMLERLQEATQKFVDKILEILYGFFPHLEESVEEVKSGEYFEPVTELLPFLKDLYWIFYVAAFFVILAVLAKMWSMSKRFIINSVAGIALLLIAIHVLEVDIKVTILKLILIALFGVPGTVFVLIAHYWGISL